MKLNRLLKVMSTGEDVRAVKDRLVELGYLHKSTHNMFGYDTQRAVRAFQKYKGIQVDGIVGEETWGMLFPEAANEPEPMPSDGDRITNGIAIPTNIGIEAARAISEEMVALPDNRYHAVMLALREAYDPVVKQSFPLSLYIRGGNLYNKDLSRNVITKKTINDGAARQPEYYAGGSKEMMLEAVTKYPDTSGADCSGGVVGILRKIGVVKNNFDVTANTLCGSGCSKAIDKAALQPADFVGREGHVGMYVGGGYVVEWAGQRYGCQLTKLDDRRVWDFVDKKMRKLSAWTKFRKPRYY